MDERLTFLLAVTASVAAALAVLLAVIKVTHRALQRYRGVRTAHYIAAIGEMLSRGIVPSTPRPGWARDPLFHEAIADYRLLVTGADRKFVDTFVEALGVGEVLVARTARRFPRSARLRALSSLVDLATPRHRDALREMIDDHNPHVRMNAIRGLARLRDVESIPRILDLVTGVEPWEVARAGDALVDMGSGGVPAIVGWIEAHGARSVEVVALSARLLGLIGDPTAESTLLHLLESPEPTWRMAAASALEHVGTDASVAPLRRALHDDDWRVRARAVVALGAMADPDVTDEVARLLADEQWWVRQNAAGALARLPGGADLLFIALDSDDPYAADAALHQLTTSGALARRRPLTAEA